MNKTIVRKPGDRPRKVSDKTDVLSNKKERRDWPESKYNEDTAEGMCEIVKDLMRDGKTKNAVCAKFEVTPKTLDKWCKLHPELQEAMDLGFVLSEAWWEELGMENMTNPDFQQAAYAHQTRNRFGWRSRDKEDRQQNNDLDTFLNAAKILEEAKKARSGE